MLLPSVDLIVARVPVRVSVPRPVQASGRLPCSFSASCAAPMPSGTPWLSMWPSMQLSCRKVVRLPWVQASGLQDFDCPRHAVTVVGGSCRWHSCKNCSLTALLLFGPLRVPLAAIACVFKERLCLASGPDQFFHNHGCCASCAKAAPAIESIEHSLLAEWAEQGFLHVQDGRWDVALSLLLSMRAGGTGITRNYPTKIGPPSNDEQVACPTRSIARVP